MATEWTMNTAQLEKGMLIRRPGLDESLEVLTVRNGQAKIKLPDGKTSTIPVSAEVEWSRPIASAQEPNNKPETASEADSERESINPEPEPDMYWDNDWSLLDVGSKIEVLGDPGDFTILRLTDSSARIKHNATGQIQPLTIGHKFKLIDSGKGDAAKDSKPAAKDKSRGKTRKPRSDKGTKVAQVEAAEEAPEISTPTLFDDEPSDEVLDAIENGDEPDDDEEIAISLANEEFDAEDAEEDDTEEDTDDEDTDHESIQPFDDEDFKENDEMPAPAPKPAKTSRSTSTSLLTLGQIAERTGISYPTLVRYVRDHGDRLPSEGEGRSRRYYPEAINIFNEIRSTTKGGRKPGAGKGGNKPANPRKMPSKPITAAPMPNRSTRTERSHETAAPYAAPARSQAKAVAQAVGTQSQSSAQTIDGMLASAIDHARAQIDGLQSLIDNLEAQRESLKIWR